MKLFSIAPQGELYITKVTRPLSFWVVLLTFIILLFLNSFKIIHTDSLYLQILKSVLMTMVGFYFTARTVEKVAAYYSKKLSTKNPSISSSSNSTSISSISSLNPDKLPD